MTDREYLVKAYKVASHSKDPSTQNGAVVPVDFKLITSCNQFSIGVEVNEERLKRPLKYNFIEHAERGVVYEAAKIGISLDSKTMYVPWAACADCSRAIICSGIKRVVCHQKMMDETPDHWKESIAFAMIMFKEAGVVVDYFKENLPEAPLIRFNGNWWQP